MAKKAQASAWGAMAEEVLHIKAHKTAPKLPHAVVTKTKAVQQLADVKPAGKKVKPSGASEVMTKKAVQHVTAVKVKHAPVVKTKPTKKKHVQQLTTVKTGTKGKKEKATKASQKMANGGKRAYLKK